MKVERFLHGVDAVSTWAGKAAAWLVIVLTGVVCVEVFKRYILNAPTAWIFDFNNMLYGTLFMLAGAYALSRNGHVRGDFLYRKWEPRTQAKLDLVLYFVFFFPGILALIYAGWGFFHLSWLINERSSFSPDGPIIWPFKGLIPLVGVLMLLQGIAEVARCVICIKTGDWPQRLHDVQELETVMMERAAAEGEISPGDISNKEVVR